MIVKYLIENGACLNSFYLNFYKVHHIKKKIVDKLEELYLLCKKPLDFYYGSGGEERHYKVENTPKNRFIEDYSFFYLLNQTFNQRTFCEWFAIFSKNEKIPDKILMEFAFKNEMNINKEKRYLKADLTERTQIIRELWDGRKQKEKEIQEGNATYDDLLGRLRRGETEYVEEEQEFFGGKNLKDLDKVYRERNSRVTYGEAMRSREQDKTTELYENLGNLSFNEVRERYFKTEVRDDERDG